MRSKVNTISLSRTENSVNFIFEALHMLETFLNCKVSAWVLVTSANRSVGIGNLASVGVVDAEKT